MLLTIPTTIFGLYEGERSNEVWWLLSPFLSALSLESNSYLRKISFIAIDYVLFTFYLF